MTGYEVVLNLLKQRLTANESQTEMYRDRVKQAQKQAAEAAATLMTLDEEKEQLQGAIEKLQPPKCITCGR